MLFFCTKTVYAVNMFGTCRLTFVHVLLFGSALDTIIFIFSGQLLRCFKSFPNRIFSEVQMGVLVRLCQKLSRKLVKSVPHCTYRRISSLRGSIDRYNGVTIRVKDQISPAIGVEDFHNLLKGNLMC